nr:SDR family oxidoreductase [Streptomyces mexicanus]
MVGSVRAHGAAPGTAPYAVTKAGLVAVARAAAAEWGPARVRCDGTAPRPLPKPATTVPAYWTPPARCSAKRA